MGGHLEKEQEHGCQAACCRGMPAMCTRLCLVAGWASGGGATGLLSACAWLDRMCREEEAAAQLVSEPAFKHQVQVACGLIPGPPAAAPVARKEPSGASRMLLLLGVTSVWRHWLQ